MMMMMDDDDDDGIGADFGFEVLGQSSNGL